MSTIKSGIWAGRTPAEVRTWQCQHTAGHGTHGQSAVYAETDGKDVALVYDGDVHAALIAAAPELLAACRAVWNTPYDANPDQFLATRNLVKSAIAKAEGRS